MSFLVWIPTHDLSSFGDPTSGCVAAGIILCITESLKPHHHGKAETPWVGGQSTQIGKMCVCARVHITHLHILYVCMCVCVYIYIYIYIYLFIYLFKISIHAIEECL
jgi:hypothetical protein